MSDLPASPRSRQPPKAWANAPLWVCGALLIAASPFFPWVNASLRRDVTGFRLVLGAEHLESGILSPASYGALALLLAALYL